jgi:hypothetical protein
MRSRRPRGAVNSRKTASTSPLPDPRAGGPLQSTDRRAEFERLSRQARRDPEAEGAFLEGRIEMIRHDPRLSKTEKARAIAKLRRALRLI